MKDREALLPNRKKITYSDGSVEYVTIEFADSPSEVGTLLNKDNLLSDAVALELGLTQTDPVSSDALIQLQRTAIQYSTMPTASEDNEGYIALFTGITGTYTNGSAYMCVSDGEPSPTYSWGKIVFNIIPSEIGAETERLQFTDVVVDNAAFTSDTTYTAFPYRAAVALTGVLSGMTPYIVFGVDDAVSGIFAPVAACYGGGVYLYASEIPASDITIPTIICWPEVS